MRGVSSIPLKINSGFRTVEQQQALYDSWMAKKPFIDEAIQNYRDSVKQYNEEHGTNLKPDKNAEKQIRDSVMKSVMPGVYPAAKPGKGPHEAARAIDTNYRHLSAKHQKRLVEIFKAHGLQAVKDPAEVHHFQVAPSKGGWSEAVKQSREDFNTQPYYRVWEVKKPEVKE